MRYLLHVATPGEFGKSTGMPVSAHLPDVLTLPFLSEAAERYRQARLAPATRLAYRRDFSYWARWARARGADPLRAPAELVCNWLSELADAGLSVPSLRRRRAALDAVRREAGLPPLDPLLLGAVLKGIAREHARPSKQKHPLLVSHLVRAFAESPRRPSLLWLRDRALLLLGEATALRRSELCALRVEDLEWCPQGLVLSVRRSKTDPEGWGRQLGVEEVGGPLCPLGALRAYLAATRIESGFLFRSVHGGVGSAALVPAAVARAVKRALRGLGEDPANYSGHSLRAGNITESFRLELPQAAAHHASARSRQLYDRRSVFEQTSVSRQLLESQGHQ